MNNETTVTTDTTTTAPSSVNGEGTELQETTTVTEYTGTSPAYSQQLTEISDRLSIIISILCVFIIYGACKWCYNVVNSFL